MNAVFWIILESFFLAEMLCAFEVSTKILDEGFESGRIQQKGHSVCVGFEFLVWDDDHQRHILFNFVRAEISAKIFAQDKWEVFQ